MASLELRLGSGPPSARSQHQHSPLQHNCLHFDSRKIVCTNPFRALLFNWSFLPLSCFIFDHLLWPDASAALHDSGRKCCRFRHRASARRAGPGARARVRSVMQEGRKKSRHEATKYGNAQPRDRQIKTPIWMARLRIWTLTIVLADRCRELWVTVRTRYCPKVRVLTAVTSFASAARQCRIHKEDENQRLTHEVFKGSTVVLIVTRKGTTCEDWEGESSVPLCYKVSCGLSAVQTSSRSP